MRTNRHSFRKTVADGITIIVITGVVFSTFFALSEYLLARFFQHSIPQWPIVINTFRDYYVTYHRKIIQYEPEFARYDKELTYTLKPGAFIFQNVEFFAPFTVNSIGARDDEKSLATPEIVVTGDSFAMGWGVGQEETFAQLIEKETNVRVLNIGVSSYGTVREMGMLRRVNTSAMKILIIQYCRNDYKENRAFMENSNKLPVTSEKEFQKIVDDYLKKSKYYYGRYTLKLLPSFSRHPFKLVTPRFPRDVEEFAVQDAEVVYFLNALINSGISLDNVLVVVLELNAYNAFTDTFTTALAAEAMKEKYPAWIRSIMIVNLPAILKEDDFFLLDGHINEKGHQKVANTLLQVLWKDIEALRQHSEMGFSLEKVSNPAKE